MIIVCLLACFYCMYVVIGMYMDIYMYSIHTYMYMYMHACINVLCDVGEGRDLQSMST